MRKSQFFLGNVNICTKVNEDNNYESKLFKTLVPLLKLNNGNYVCVDSIDSINAYINLYHYIINNKNTDLVLSKKPFKELEYFVDETSLVPYYEKNEDKEKTTIRKVKKDLLIDPRIPRGIDLDEVIKIYSIVKIKRYSTK